MPRIVYVQKQAFVLRSNKLNIVLLSQKYYFSNKMALIGIYSVFSQNIRLAVEQNIKFT